MILSVVSVQPKKNRKTERRGGKEGDGGREREGERKVWVKVRGGDEKQKGRG